MTTNDYDRPHRPVPRPSRMKWYGQQRLDGLTDWQGTYPESTPLWEPTRGWEASQ